MAKDQPRPPDRGWRKGVPASDRAQKAQPGWKRETEAGQAKPRWSKKARLGTALLALGAFIGLVVVLILLFRPIRPAGLVLIGGEYKTKLTLPPNVCGFNGLQQLADLAESGSSGSFLSFLFGGSGKPTLSQAPSRLYTNEIIEWGKGLEGVSEKTIVLALALHAGVDNQGAYFLPDDADPTIQTNRLRLSDVLDRLEKLPDKYKVVLLDATQMTHHWQLGMLHNDFVRKLKEAEPRIESIPNLVVLCATDEDQRSWVSEEWRTTIFLHYVAEGLKGAANPEGNRISALDLYRYVRASVERWAQDNRVAVQTPILLPSKGGEDLAAKMYLAQVSGYEASKPEEAAGLSFQAPAKLREAWNDHQQLAVRTIPHPAVYTPHLWRLYEDTLLRTEQLVRAGEKEANWDTLIRLRDEMTRTGTRLLGSAQSTLVMPAALGLNLQLPGLDAKLEAIWGDEKGEYRDKWQELPKWAAAHKNAAGKENLVEPLLQVKASQFLVKQVMLLPTGKRAGLRTAANVLAAIDRSGTPRPAEAHFLRMLDRDLDKPPPPDDLLQTALAVRILAEQTALSVKAEEEAGAIVPHPYSEQVYAWIKDHMRQADQERRLGEDLLFASTKEKWAEAGKHLGKANDLYVQAQTTIAGPVRDALETRDRVLAALPYYSQWLARQRAAEAAQAGFAQGQQLDKVERLWKRVHELAAWLDKPSGQVEVAKLAELTGEVNRGFQEIESAFRETCDRLKNAQVHQDPWHEIDAALSVPYLEPSLRMSLLEKLRGISAKLHTETGQKRDPQAPAAVQTALEPRAVAERQGRMALAVLGEEWFNSVRVKDPKEENNDFNQVFQLVRSVEQNWREPLGRAGSQIGFRWRQMPERLRATAGSRLKDLPTAAAELTQGERLARLIDGPAVEQTAKQNPVEEMRSLRLHDLLLWQTQRTIQDHWFDVALESTAKPYYLFAGAIYVDDAQALAGLKRGDLTPDQKRLREKGSAELAAQLKNPTELTLDRPERTHVTSENEFELEFLLKAPEGLPPGHPVLWNTPDKFLLPAGDSGGGRQVVNTLVDAKLQNTFAYRVKLRNEQFEKYEKDPPPEPKIDPTKAAALGLYRGQRLSAETKVDLHRLPEVVVYQQPAREPALIALRADDELRARFAASNSQMVIILDCSGSMDVSADPKKKYGEGLTRFDEARRALLEVLRGIPPETTVSVWVYGQSDPEVQSLADVEKTIKPLESNVRWDPTRPGQLAELKGKIDRLKPSTFTPIVRAMMDSRQDFDKARLSGFKTMLIITDGDDTRFERKSVFVDKREFKMPGDLKYNPGGDLKIAPFLFDAFKDSGIIIKMVGFQVEEGEQKSAKDQFQKVIEKLKGTYYDSVKESEKLIANLRQALRQRLLVQIEKEGARPPGIPAEGLDVSDFRQNRQFSPALEAGIYLARLKAEEVKQQQVLLKNNDRLLINLSLRGFARGLLSDEPQFATRERSEGPASAKRWRMTTLQNQADKSAWQLLTTLERLPDGQRVETLTQIAPQFAWFEVQTQDVERPGRFGLRWGGLPGYPAPAWSFDVKRWPNRYGTEDPALPHVRAWLSEGQMPGLVALRRGDFNSVFDLAGRQIDVDKERVVIESVAVEPRYVAAAAGGDLQAQSCLVVRLRYPKGRPVFVQVDPSEGRGYEHRFYTEANKYTGVFWTWSRDDAADNVRTVSLVSVEAFKEARNAVLPLELKLKAPTPGDIRPTPDRPDRRTTGESGGQ